MRDMDVTRDQTTPLPDRAGDVMFERSPVGVARTDAHGNLLQVNDALCELLGYAREDLIGKNGLELTYPDDRDATEQNFDAALADDGVFSIDKRYVRGDGSILHARVSVSSVPAPDGTLDHLLAHLVDRSAEVAALDAARWAAARYERLLSAAADVVVVLDEDGVTRFVSPNIREILGQDADAILGLPLQSLVHPQDLAQVRVVFDGVVGTGEGATATYRVRHGDGRWRWVEARCVDRRSEPVVNGFVCNLRDVTERVEIEAELRRQALHDTVTGLPNRTLLADRIETAIARSARAKRTFAVLFCDLDHFKHANDTLGHEAGDQLLVAVADRLRGALRAGDTLARVGGDEFVVLLELLREPEAATLSTRLAESLLDELAEPLSITGHLLTVSASIGIAVHTPGRSVQDMLRDADVAMYAAKNRGRAQYVLHDQSMRAAVEERFEMDGVIRRAIATDGVTVEFQPIVELVTQRIIGAEALVRLDVDGVRHPPDAFIDTAEEAGTIVPLGERVLEVALDEMTRWPRDTYVAINMSARQLAADDVAGHVLGMIAARGIDPHRVVLEVTESALVESTARIDATMASFAEAGVRIALDDFGTGFSSLSYLRRFPVGIVKIDRSFVAGVDRIGSGDIEVIRAVIGLAGALGIQVVAEGIETEIQAAILTELGCTLGQGYLYGRPSSRLLTPASASWS